MSKMGIAKTSLTIKKKTPVKAKINYVRFKRELIPDFLFSLKDRNWSPWQLILSSNASYSKQTNWYKYLSFYVKKDIEIQQENKLSLFELAVQIKPGSEHYVVFNHISRCISGKTWERRLFAQKNIRRQVDKVAKRGFAFYLRRLPLKNDKMKRNIENTLKKYDYPWKKVRNERSSHRQVEIDENIISDKSL